MRKLTIVPAALATLVLVQGSFGQVGQREAAPPDQQNRTQTEQRESGQRATDDARRDQTAQPRQNQQRTDQQEGPITREALRPVAGQNQEIEQFVANCLILGNEEEIALSKLALEKAENPQVKEFAQKMINDHQQLSQQLQQFASRKSIKLDTTSTDAARTQPGATRGDGENVREDAAREETAADRVRSQVREAREQVNERVGNATQDRAGRTEDRTVASQGHGGTVDQLFSLQEDAARHCLTLTKQELTKQEGSHFDKAFMGHQIGAHIGMLSKLKASEGYVSGELQQLVQKAQQSTMQHKQMAEQIKKQLAESDEPSTGADRQRRSAAQPDRTPPAR